ncbi:hypothetical protein BLA29_002883, partial [Euroglyphus maynei]
MSMRKLIEKFHEHIFPLFYYNHIILKKWPEFFSNEDDYKRQKKFNKHLSRSFYHVILPGLNTTFVALSLFIYINYTDFCRQYSLWLVAEFPPEHGKLYTITVAIIWSILHMFQMFYGIRTNLRDFIFLIILNLNPSAVEHDVDHLNRLILNVEQRKQLKSFEKRIIFGLKLISHLIGVVGYTAMALQIIMGRLWERSMLWLIIWIFIYASWSYYICSALYQFPTILHSIFHYIKLKQNSLQKQMIRLNQLIQCSILIKQQSGYRMTTRFIRLNRMNLQIKKEIVEMNNQTKRITTILLSGFTVLITYLTFLIFFAEMFPIYRLLFIIVYSDIEENTVWFYIVEQHCDHTEYIYYQTNDSDVERIPRSLLHIVMPSISNAVYIFGAISFVIWSEHLEKYSFFSTLPAFLPVNARKYNLIVVTVWAMIVIIQMFYGLSTRINQYRFLDILHIQNNNENGRKLSSEHRLQSFILIRD